MNNIRVPTLRKKFFLCFKELMRELKTERRWMKNVKMRYTGKEGKMKKKSNVKEERKSVRKM